MLFSSFVCHFSRTLYSLSVPGKQERAAPHTVLRTEIMRGGTCLDSFQWLPSMTFSVMPLLLRILNGFWPFEDCYLLGFVFAQFFYCLKLPCMKIYKHAFLQTKHPCFTRDLGPLCTSSHWLQSPGPGLQRLWKLCPFFLLENFRPLSPWGPLDFLSTCLGNDSLSALHINVFNPHSEFNK